MFTNGEQKPVLRAWCLPTSRHTLQGVPKKGDSCIMGQISEVDSVIQTMIQDERRKSQFSINLRLDLV